MNAIYKIIGEDGKEYGPATVGQIRQWIAEGRVERQTPIFVDGAKDWNFVGLLPEFTGCFAASNFCRRTDGENQFLRASWNDFRYFIGDLLLRVSFWHSRIGVLAHRVVTNQREPGTARRTRHGHRRIDSLDFEPAARRRLGVF